MIYTPMTKLAMKIAYEAHLHQLDKSGIPYIYHPMMVACNQEDEMSTSAALLHDVVEDTNITLEELSKHFPSEVIEALSLLTHDDKEDYFAYIARIKSNSIARNVKLADLKHNSDLNRLDKIDEKSLDRMKKYEKAMKILTE